MVEVIWHARGGQGAFTAARCLGAAAALSADAHALAFPTFGPERRGAPVCAYTKISDSPIGDRSVVRQADIVIYLDETLMTEEWASELAPGGVVLLNTTRHTDDARIICVDADAISRDILGRAIPNTAFLGAIAAISDAVSLEDVHVGIEATMPARLQDPNIRIADAAAAVVERSKAACGEERAPRTVETGSVCAVAPAGMGERRDGGRQGASHTPYLRTSFDASDGGFARSTCFEAGHLVSKNAGWRSSRPVLDDVRCTKCLNCYQLCPDGTIYKVRDATGGLEALSIDYAFCKGCGVCAEVCPVSCISMVPEAEEVSA